jgi:phosphoribosylformylglycinamidine synthase
MDLKQPGNVLFLVGETRDELGGSHFALVNELSGGQVPTLEPERSRRVFTALHAAMRRRLVRSCHDLSEGGLAVALAEAAFAGGLGPEIDLQTLSNANLSDAALLFAESNTRFIVEVAPSNAAAFAETLDGLPCVQIGSVTESDRLVVRAGKGSTLLDASLAELKEAWQRPLNWS